VLNYETLNISKHKHLTMKKPHYVFRGLPLLALAALLTLCCDDEDNGRKRIVIKPGETAQADAQKAFINASNGTDIYFEEGKYEFTSQLSIDGKHDVRILGESREKTILSFKNQSGSGEGLFANQCTQLLFSGFTIADTKGDALKVKSCDQVTFTNIATIWSGDPREENGGYGLYPVESTNVLIEKCYAYGASDSGIYVGQSTNVVIRNCTVEGNVAGIEIENTISADVYDNEVSDNAGGILVFDLPGLTQYGSNCRVFNNNCYNNNRTNFAPVGNIVGNVPAGTGIMLLSTRKVEVFDNKLSDNMFGNIIMASYLLIGTTADATYNPYYADVYVHDNTYSRAGTFNPAQGQVGGFMSAFMNAYGFQQPDLLIDNLTMGGVCVSEADEITFVNLHAELINWETGEGKPDADLGSFTCVGTSLNAVTFEPYASSL
jgi:parallel beta-helix repeat protein